MEAGGATLLKDQKTLWLEVETWSLRPCFSELHHHSHWNYFLQGQTQCRIHSLGQSRNGRALKESVKGKPNSYK